MTKLEVTRRQWLPSRRFAATANLVGNLMGRPVLLSHI